MVKLQVKILVKIMAIIKIIFIMVKPDKASS